MHHLKKIIGIVLLVLLGATISFAAPLKVYVAPFTVVGTVKDKDESKSVLQALLTAKLSDGTILPVISSSDAEIVAQGTYVTIGSQYSLDIVLLDSQKAVISRRVITGTSNSPSYFAMIDAIATGLKDDLAKAPRNAARLANVDVKADVVRPNVQRQKNSDVIYAQTELQDKSRSVIPRMAGEFSLIRKLKSQNSIVLADDHAVTLLRVSDNAVVFKKRLAVGSQIINIDSLMLGAERPTIFVSYIHMNKAYTDVYEYTGTSLDIVREKEPYFSRIVRLNGEKECLLIQEQGEPDKPYYGAVYLGQLQNKKLEKMGKVDLPEGVSLYEFNQFKDVSNEVLTIAYDKDGYLAVYDKSMSSIWKSSEKFGRSQLSFQIHDLNYLNKTGKEYRTYFINQRILVTPKQSIIVGYNDSNLSVGDMRTFKKGIVYGFKWNGGSLDELWHTAPTQNYMPDFEYDDDTASLYQLQRTQSEGIFQRQDAMSSVLVKKVE